MRPRWQGCGAAPAVRDLVSSTSQPAVALRTRVPRLWRSRERMRGVSRVACRSGSLPKRHYLLYLDRVRETKGEVYAGNRVADFAAPGRMLPALASRYRCARLDGPLVSPSNPGPTTGPAFLPAARGAPRPPVAAGRPERIAGVPGGGPVAAL